MAQTTEAACLLQTGALYTRRIGLKGPTGELVFAGIKRGAFSLYFDDDPIYHFDLEGRWQRAYIDGIHYRKGLDNGVDAIERVREGANLVLKRRPLAFSEVTDLDERIREVALGRDRSRDRSSSEASVATRCGSTARCRRSPVDARSYHELGLRGVVRASRALRGRLWSTRFPAAGCPSEHRAASDTR